MGVDRGVEHDRCRLGKDRQQGLDQEIRTLEIDGERAVEACLVPLFDRLQLGDAGIDEQDIERAEGGADLFSDGGLAGDIAGIGLDDQSCLAKDGAGFGNVLRIGAGDGDPCTFGDELACGFEADAAGAAGDECRLVLQT
ncbi:hypothetical protein D9M72_496820 [compost metagenome]